MDAINRTLSPVSSIFTSSTHKSEQKNNNYFENISTPKNPLTQQAENITNKLITAISGSTDAVTSDLQIPTNGVTSIDSDGVPSFDENHPDYHHYFTSNSCSKNETWCNYETAVQGLLRYPAPGASGEPIQDEQAGFATPVGYVTHEVYDDGARIYNITQEDKHILDPGIVKRWVSDSQNDVTINTFGEGTGNMGGLNNWLADPLWKAVDENIFDYMRNKGTH